MSRVRTRLEGVEIIVDIEYWEDEDEQENEQEYIILSMNYNRKTHTTSLVKTVLRNELNNYIIFQQNKKTGVSYKNSCHNMYKQLHKKLHNFMIHLNNYTLVCYVHNDHLLFKLVPDSFKVQV
jgi:hypothetical protein